MRSEKRLGAGSVVVATMVLAVGLGWIAAGESEQEAPRNLNQIDYAMYFLSEVKDGPECGMSVEDGRVVIAAPVTNPAMSCPDMFGWRLFAEVIQSRFWERWADETQNWPEKPYRLCTGREDPTDEAPCCKPGDPDNDPAHCPVFPGDRAVDPGERRLLRQSIRSHLFGPHEAAADETMLRQVVAPATVRSAEDRSTMKPCRELPLPDDPESIGRVIRQTNGELTLRNRAFHEFVFRNNLYNANGLIEAFGKNARNIYTNAPYRRVSRPDLGDGRGADLAKISFPPDAVMLKSNWLNADLMAAIAEKYGWDWENPAHPYIHKEMAQTLEDQAGNEYDCTGVHRLLAFHISSKDIPNWVWATFEHVRLPGRCDFTGCNDSWGYFSSDSNLPADAARNYLRPKTKDDDLPQGADSMVFAHDELYAAEEIRPQLAAVLDALRIGVERAGGAQPTPADQAWRSYRLKGTQVEFVDSMGRPTFLGHSVTEAGFVNGSSCITCHSRAGTDADGPFHPGVPGRGTFPLSVFQNDLSDFGYGRSAHGVPNKNWYHQSNQPPALQVLQTDFVWGFLFARPTIDDRR